MLMGLRGEPRVNDGNTMLLEKGMGLKGCDS